MQDPLARRSARSKIGALRDSVNSLNNLAAITSRQGNKGGAAVTMLFHVETNSVVNRDLIVHDGTRSATWETTIPVSGQPVKGVVLFPGGTSGIISPQVRQGERAMAGEPIKKDLLETLAYPECKTI
jgi:hypothetical protein